MNTQPERKGAGIEITGIEAEQSVEVMCGVQVRILSEYFGLVCEKQFVGDEGPHKTAIN